MRESKTLEFKETISNTFLKTVSAYANYGTGKILFGVTDEGETKGLQNPSQACLDIENRINDSLDPVPEYVIALNEKNAVITLRFSKGCISRISIKRRHTGGMIRQRLRLTGWR